LNMNELQRIGEVVEASTTDFVAQCYELYQLPPLGSLVKTRDLPVELYGIVYQAATTSLEPGRRPIARGKDEPTEEEIYRSNPQLAQLLRSEFSVLVVGHRQDGKLYHYLPPQPARMFSVLVVGHRQDGKLYHYLPPQPARIHAFVYQCPAEEVNEFSQSFDFINILLNTHLPISVEEIIAASLRDMGRAHEDPHAFLVAAGKELAMLLGGEFNRLNAILGRIKG